MKKTLAVFGLLAVFLLTTGFTSPTGYRWRDHNPPFDFLFGNHIDVHQQSKVSRNGHLVGFLYIRFTGEFTDDGIPKAEHADCTVVPDACTVGWTLKGVPVQATYLGHTMGEHPQWAVDAGDLPRQPGYSHFHWLNESAHADGLVVGETYEGYLLKLTARDTFFFEHHGGFTVMPGIDDVTHANIVVTAD